MLWLDFCSDNETESGINMTKTFAKTLWKKAEHVLACCVRCSRQSVAYTILSYIQLWHCGRHTAVALRSIVYRSLWDKKKKKRSTHLFIRKKVYLAGSGSMSATTEWQSICASNPWWLNSSVPFSRIRVQGILRVLWILKTVLSFRLFINLIAVERLSFQHMQANEWQLLVFLFISE